jgi:hypothetical protein
MTRGLTVFETYRSLQGDDRNIGEQELFECCVLGWCVEAVRVRNGEIHAIIRCFPSVTG